MKKLILLFAISLAVVSCSKEDATAIDSQENLVQQLNTDISQQAPQTNYDQSQKGLYAGVIVANNTEFHGKLWVNIGNDTNYNALVHTIDGDKLEFALDTNTASLSKNIFTFTNERGSFTVDVSDYNNVKVNNITIDGTEGHAFVGKQTHGHTRMISLGTYDAALLGTTTGTWDIMADAVTGLITEVMITGAGGGMHVDAAANFEVGQNGCYADSLPFFVVDLDPLVNQYELYSVGQSLTLANGMTLVYDFGFSKNIQDANLLPYDGGVYFPEATNSILFGDIALGCYSIGAKGYYVATNAAGDALVSAGAIDFDTSALVPVPPPPTASSNTLEEVQVRPLK